MLLSFMINIIMCHDFDTLLQQLTHLLAGCILIFEQLIDIEVAINLRVDAKSLHRNTWLVEYYMFTHKFPWEGEREERGDRGEEWRA